MANKFLVKIADKIERSIGDYVKRYGKRAVKKLGNHVESAAMGATLGATGGYVKGQAAEQKRKLDERKKKKLEKKAAKLPSEAKDYARKLISKSRTSGKPYKPNSILHAILKPSQPDSYGDEIRRAKNIAARVTKNAGQPSMGKAMQEKVASLLKGKKLIMKTSPGSIPAVKGKAKDIGMIGRMIDRVDQVERISSRAGSTYKTRLNLPDGYKGFIRASDKGVRSRLYKDD